MTSWAKHGRSSRQRISPRPADTTASWQRRTLFISGQLGWDSDAHIVSPDFGVQFLQALDNVIAVVREAGGGSEHLVKLLAFVTDLDAYRSARTVIGEGWRARMGNYYPAMSLVKVAGLLEPGALVEIEGVAALPA